MTIHPFAGNKAGGGAKNAADNLFSEDQVEVILAVSEGPIKGLRGGKNHPTAYQNFFVGDTPLYGPDKQPNFKNLDLTIYKGDPDGQVIKPKLGGFGTSIDVNTRLDYNLPLTRQTLKHNVDFLELRLVVNALYQETDKGTKEHSVQLKIEKRKLSDSAWSPAFLTSDSSVHSDDDKKQQHKDGYDLNTARIVRNGRNFRHWWQNSAPPTSGNILIADDHDKPEVQRTYNNNDDYYNSGQDYQPAVVHDASYLAKNYSKHLFTWFDKNDNNRPYWLARTGTTRKYVQVGTRQSHDSWDYPIYEWQTFYTYAWQQITGAVFVNDGEKKYWKWTTNGYFADRVHQNKGIEYDRAAFFDIEDIDDEDAFRNGDIWLRDEGQDHILMYNGSAWDLPADNSGTVPEEDADSGIYPDGIIKISGKTTAPYVKELRIGVSRVDEPYQIKITKQTDDSDTKKRAEVQWESIQEITRDPMSFKNLAIAHVTGRATDQFTSLPDFSGIYEGRIVKVPNNYDVVKRTYNGNWDGASWSTKINGVPSFTNNPAFIVKDLVENTTYGLSAFYPVYLNNWDVYEAAAWCDVKVNDGKGGKRPRVTFNGLISEARPTREAIEYICGTFGARFFDDGNGSARIKIDKDDPAVMLFTPEKVQDGLFVYSMTSNEQRINDYTVEYTEPDLNWQTNRIRINDYNHSVATMAKNDIAARGRFAEDFTAVGCTSLSEALARGRYKVITNLTEKIFVSFKTNRQGLYVDPYDIILIADEDSDFGLHGRVKEKVDSDTISLRDPIYLEAGFTYVAKFQTINYTTGLFEIVERTITAGSAGTSRYDLHFTSSLPSQVTADTPFTVEASSIGVPKAFRVLTLTEEDGEPDLISVTAIEVNRNKWTQIDGGIDEVNFAPVKPQAMTPVRGLRIHAKKIKVGEDPLWNMTLTWKRHSNTNIRKYEIWHKVNGGSWKRVGVSGGLSYEMDNAHQGLHMFRIQGIDKDNHHTDAVYQSFSLVGTKRTVKKPVGLKLKNYVAAGAGVFEANDAIFTWSKNAIDKDKYWTRFQIEILDPVSGVVQRTTTTTTNEYRYTYTDNKADFLGTPSRIVKIRVRQVDKFGNVSPGAVFTATNVAPAVPVGVYVQKGFSSIIVTYSVPEKLDFLGIKVHVGSTPGFTPDASNLEYTGKNTRVEIPVSSVVASPKYVKIAAYDRFSQSNLNYSSDISIVVPKHPIYDTVAPGVPTGFSVTALANQAKAVWQNPNDNDLRAVELWYNTANDISTATRVYRALGERATVVDFQTGVPYWFWARSVDNAENYSAFIGPIQITGRKGVVVTEIEDGAIEEAKTTSYVPNAPSAAPTLNSITGDIDGDGTLDLGYTAGWNVPAVDSTHSAAKMYEIEVYRRATDKGTDGNNVTGYTLWKKFTSITESLNFEVVSKYFHKARVRGISFANKPGAWSAYTSVGVRHPGYNSMAGVTPAAPTVAQTANGYKISWAKPTDPTYLETEILVGGVNLTKVSATSYTDQTQRTLGQSYNFTIRHFDKSGNSTNQSAATPKVYRGIEGVDIAPGSIDKGKITVLVPNAPATAVALNSITGDIDNDGTLDLGYTASWPVPVVDSTHVDAENYELEIYRRAGDKGTDGNNVTGYTLWKKLVSQTESINFEVATKYFYKARVRGIGFAGQKGTWSAYTSVGVRHPNYNAMAGVTPAVIGISQTPNGYKLSWPKSTAANYLETEIFVDGVSLTRVSATSYLDQTQRTLGQSYAYTYKHYDRNGNSTNLSPTNSAVYRGIEGVDIAPGSIDKGKITVLVPNAPASAVSLNAITGDIDNDGTLDLGYTASWPVPASDSTHVDAEMYELEIYRAAAAGTAGSMTGYALWKKLTSQTESINFEVATKWYYKARVRGIGFGGQKGAWSAYTNVGVRHPNYNAMTFTPAAPAVQQIAKGYKISWAKPTDPSYLETEILVDGVSLTKVSATSYTDQTLRTLGQSYAFTLKHYDKNGNSTIAGTATNAQYRGIQGVDVEDGTLGDAKITPLVPAAPTTAPAFAAVTGDIDNDGKLDLIYTITWPAPVAVAGTSILAVGYEIELYRATAAGTAGNNVTGYTLWKKVITNTESLNIEVSAKYYHKARVRGIGFGGQKGVWSAYTNAGAKHTGYNAMAGVTPAAPTVAAIGAGFKVSWAALADPTYYETEILVGGVALARNSGTTFVDNTVRTKGTSYSYTIRHYDRAGNATNVSAATAVTYRGINNADIEDDAVTVAKTDGTAPATPGALTLTQIAKDIDLDGKVDIGIKVSWAASAGAVRYEVEMSECATTNGTYVVVDNAITSALLMSFKTSTTKYYRFRIRSFSFNGTPSAWTAVYPSTTTGFKPTKKTATPTAPGVGTIDGPGYTSSAGNGIATIYWDRSPDPDYAYTEVWLNPNNSSAYGYLASRVNGTTFMFSGMRELPVYIWLRNVDTSGNKSAYYSMNEFGPAISAGADKINGRKIEQASIPAAKMMFTDSENMIPDGMFCEEYGAPLSSFLDYWTISGGTYNKDDPSSSAANFRAYYNTNYIRSGNSTLLFDRKVTDDTISLNILSREFQPCVGATPLAWEISISGLGSTSVDGALFRIYWYDQNQTACDPTPYNSVYGGSIPAAQTTYRGIITPPTAARFYKVRMYHSSSSTIRYMVLDHLSVRKAEGQNLIPNKAILGAKIADNEVNARILAPRDFGNLIPGASLDALTEGWNAPDPGVGGTITFEDSTTAFNGRNIKFTSGSLTASSTSSYLYSITSDRFPVEPGQKYAFGMMFDPNTGFTGGLHMYLQFFDGLDVEVASSAVIIGNTDNAGSATAQVFDTVATAPAGAAKARVYFRRRSTANGGTATGTAYVRNAYVRKATETKLVADNAITVTAQATSSTSVALSTTEATVGTIALSMGTDIMNVILSASFVSTATTAQTIRLKGASSGTLYTVIVTQAGLMGIDFSVDKAVLAGLASETFTVTVQLASGTGAATYRRITATALKR